MERGGEEGMSSALGEGEEAMKREKGRGGEG